MKTPVLETDRLILRPVTLDDAPAIQKYFNNWKIIQNLSMDVPWPYPDDGAETFLRNIAIKQMDEGKGMVWALTLKENPEETIGLIDFSFDNQPGDLGNRGFWIAEHLHGQGLMTEAITATQDFLFFEIDIEKLLVSNAKSNHASRKVKEKTGAVFLRAGKLKHHSGEEESEIWEVTRESWKKFRDAQPLPNHPGNSPGV